RFGDLVKRLRERGISAEITPRAARAVAELSHDPQFGARPINRFIQRRLENPLSRLLLAGALKTGTHLVVDFRDGDFLFNGKTAEEALQAGQAETAAAEVSTGRARAGSRGGANTDGGAGGSHAAGDKDDATDEAEDAEFREV